ncbi:MAG: protoporphyrinogen oxidase [Chloroflexi bacterium]|nr:protoporphyrinogen oxidase [Chloroflexota bacterium]
MTCTSTRVVVIGAGVAGLATTHYLLHGDPSVEHPLDVTLVEASERAGGKVVTRRRDGFVVEGGPDCFLTQKPWAVDLCRHLGLESRLIGTNEASRKVLIPWGGKMHQLPDGVLLIVPTRFAPFAFSPLISPLGKLRMGLDLVLPARRDSGDESVASFVRRRLGGEALDKIAEPLMGGIHVSDPERQSILATFPRFRDIERKHGSLVRGMLAARRARPAKSGKELPMFMTLRGGLGELVDALSQSAAGARCLFGQRALAVQPTEAGAYRVVLDDGGVLRADQVVLAVPARVAAELVRGFAGELSARLRSLRYVSTATVSLGYRRSSLSRPLDGFGFVVPTKEGRRITGCTWSSTKFDDRAPDGHVLVRCFLGGAVDETPALLPEDEMVALAREELRDLMGLKAEPVLSEVFSWRQAHPQYDVGHLRWLAEVEALAAQLPGLHLVGSSYRGVGLPDCIRSGKAAAGLVLSATMAEEVVGR